MDYESKEQFKVFLVGVARNVEYTIKKDLEILTKALSDFGIVDVFIVESDSSDGTVNILKKLAENNQSFTYFSAGKLADKLPNRIERLKFCRNIYVDEIRKRVLTDKYRFVVVADLDGINNYLTKESLKNITTINFEWDALFANQIGRYYDIAALRHKYWSPNNCFEAQVWWSQYKSNNLSKKRQVYDRMIKIDKDSEAIGVDSAFGGFAIYRPWVFNVGNYVDNCDNSDIDHVIFHRKIVMAGGKLFILPSLINGRWNNHNLGSFLFLRNLRKFLVYFPFLFPFRLILRRVKIFITK